MQMYLALVLDFVLSYLPELLIYKLHSLSIRTFRTIFGSDDGPDWDDSVSNMSDRDVWFDGVDKRLIEAHSKKIDLVPSSDKSLLTKSPLLSNKGILEKRKLYHLREKKSSMKKADRDKPSRTCPYKNFDDKRYTLKPTTGVTDELALDCEMVECAGKKSVLARVSVVNLFGHPLLDSYVKPPSKVTDYRTRWSGIRESDLKNAPDFEIVQAQVASLIKDKIVVGHAVHNDFAVLKIDHPKEKTRDTSHYYGRNYFLGNTPSLKKLCQSLLGITIQKGEHDSVQDAQATMKLYVKAREKWVDHANKIAIKQGATKTKKQKTKPAKKKVKAFFVETI